VRVFLTAAQGTEGEDGQRGRTRRTRSGGRFGNLPHLGDELITPAGHGPEGSYRQGPERLRVTVQLLAMPASVPVWGETFNDDLMDPFSAQDAIAHRVAEALVPS
jgi:hypothetical protein